MTNPFSDLTKDLSPDRRAYVDDLKDQIKASMNLTTPVTPLSSCCKVPIFVAGRGSTHWYCCTKCQKPADVISKCQKPADTVSSVTETK